MKEKFSIYFFLFICFFMSFSVCTFASDGSSDSDEEDTSFGEQIANVLYTLGYALDDLTDGSKVEGLGAVGADFLRGIAIGVDSDAVLQADALFGEGILTEVEYYERLCYLLYEHNYLLSADVDMEGQFVSSFNGFSEVAVEAFEVYIEQNYLDYGVVYTYSYDNVPVEMCGGLRDSFLDFLKHEGGNIPNTSGLSSNAIFNFQFNYGNGVIFTKNVTGFSLVLDSASSISVNDIVWHWEHVLHPDTGSLLSTSQVSGFRTYNSEGVYDTFHSGYRFYGNWDSPRDYTWDTFSWNIGSTFGLRRVKSGSGYAGSVNWFISESVQPILVFETEEAMAQYLSGQLDCYRIPTDYTGGDIVVDTNIDYDALYDTIRDAVSGLEGASPSDIQQAINDAVSGYLDDIKFNTAETNTWLQRIYNKLEDIRAEVSSGFDWIKTELAALLVVNVVDIVWDDVKEDIEDAAAMAASLKDLAESKFPFSIAKDIGLLLTMFRAEPVEPVFEIPFNLLGNETVVVLDLTSAEDFLPYVRGGFILVFIAGLFGLSIKIIPIISGGV